MANFQLMSKKNIGGAMALFLVILLSQARIFNFLLDTLLGRMMLVAFLLVISYLNKIFGVVSVLLIIIMFNNSGLGYMEGFTSDSEDKEKNKETIKSDAENTANTVKSDAENTANTAKSNAENTATTVKSDAENTATTAKTDAENTANTAKSNMTEGFDIIGKENNIKRGKQSNSIPVNDFMRESDHVSPHEGFTKFESFSAFHL
jgi:hypothetical protein